MTKIRNRLPILFFILVSVLLVAGRTTCEWTIICYFSNPTECQIVSTNCIDTGEEDNQDKDENGEPDCGKNPYKWNPIGEHYERKFNQWCEPYTGDPNESLLHGTWFGE
jgi:hypothetical protein